ncbi:acyl-CoA N-acyltransferase [Flammula alnicola]|nr:acyl-CoA N-acyltransferase [Flammula alnicola]
MFVTERLRLRACRPSDLDNLLRLTNNRYVAPLMNSLFPVPRTMSIEYVNKAVDKAIMFCIVELLDADPDSAFIGFINFQQKEEPGNRDTNVGIGFLPEYWNNGYGTEVMKFMVDYAFISLNMHRVSLIVHEENERAAAVYKKIGFVEEVRSRKARWTNGSWQDNIHMGVLQEEWAERRSLEA